MVDDLGGFLKLLSALPRHEQPELRAMLDPDRPVTIARAPGRLDVMGGIADYSARALPATQAETAGARAEFLVAGGGGPSPAPAATRGLPLLAA